MLVQFPHMNTQSGQDKRPFSPKPLLIVSILLALILFAFALRLHHLDSFSFWTDEGLTSWRASTTIPEILSNNITIQEGTGKDTHPPLYYLLIHFTQQAWGESDFAMRYLSVLAGVLLVPLLYQFGRRLSGVAGGMVAAGLTAVNPLQIWYAQEARMYTLLVLLAAAMSYLLWQMLASNKWRRYLPPYLLLAALAMYTHYSAVFLIAVQSIFIVRLLWRNGQRKLVAGTAVLLFLAAIPLIPLTIPRLFTGAEAAYNRVSPLVILQDAVQHFSLGVTVDFSQPLIQFLVAAMALLAILGIITYSTWSHWLFLLSYLFAAPIGIIVLSTIKPMYLGVRHIMIGSPALLLIIAQSVGWILFSMKRSSSSFRKAGWAVAVVVTTAVLLFGPAKAIHNLYNDDRYAKDNFRDLIRYIEQNAGENDIIIYNDAVLLATNDHYQQRDLPVTAVPVYPHSAQKSIHILPDLAAQYDRIWFLPDPPDDGRDAEQAVQTWLDENAERLGTHNTYGRGALLQVISYATGGMETAVSTSSMQAVLPATAQPLDIHYPSLPPLVGIDYRFEQPTALSTLWFDLFWGGDGTIPAPEQQLRFILRGGDGVEWVMSEQDLRVTAVNWQTDQLIRQPYPVAIPVGTPPGAYILLVQPVGADAQPVAEISLAASERLSERPVALFQNGLSLLNIITPNEVRPGHALPLTLYWQADTPLIAADLHYNLQLIAPDGTLFQDLTGSPAPDWLTHFPENMPIVEYAVIHFPPTAATGSYQLRWQLWGGDGIVGGRPFLRPYYTDQIDIGTIEVTPWPLETDLPADVTITHAQFGDDIELYGYEVEQTGDALAVTLYWQAIVQPTRDYFSFIHLVDEAGEVVTERGFVPADGLRPTQGWRAGELLTDSYTIELTSDIPSGTYTLVAGLFDPETWERPLVTYENEHQADDQFILKTIEIE